MTREILTKKGQVILVDDADYELVKHMKWHLTGPGYVACAQKAYRGPASRVFLHRLLMGLQFGDIRHVDHDNGDKLDNRRIANLRVCTNSQNQCNRGAQKNNTSGFKGVSFHKRSGKWRATIEYRRSRKQLGLFESPKDAHEFYSLAADMLHGEFANHGRA